MVSYSRSPPCRWRVSSGRGESNWRKQPIVSCSQETVEGAYQRHSPGDGETVVHATVWQEDAELVQRLAAVFLPAVSAGRRRTGDRGNGRGAAPCGTEQRLCDHRLLA